MDSRSIMPTSGTASMPSPPATFGTERPCVSLDEATSLARPGATAGALHPSPGIRIGVTSQRPAGYRLCFSCDLEILDENH